MKLSDVVSGFGLQTYAEVALVIFMVVFAGVAVRVFVKRRDPAWEHASRLPLEEGEKKDNE